MAFPVYKMRKLFDPGLNGPDEEQDNDPFKRVDFTPPDDTSPNAATTSSPAGTNSSQLLDTYGKLSEMKPGPAQTAYRDFLSTAPKREDYQPGKMQRIANILSGVAAGYRNPGAGVATTEALNDEPFEKANSDYAAKAGRLEKGAELEEKDIANRVKTYRDIEDFNRRTAADAETATYRGRMAGAAEKRANAAANKPSSYFTDANTGHRFAITFGDNGQTNQYDLGKVGLTPDEQVGLEKKKVQAGEDIRQPNREKLIKDRAEEVRKNIQTRLKSAEDLVDFKKSNPNYKLQVDDQDRVVAIDMNDPSAEAIPTSIKSSKLTDQQRADLNLRNAKDLEAERQKNRDKLEKERQQNRVDLKAAPGADKTVTVSGNTSTTSFKRDNNNKLVPPTGFVRFRNKQDKREGIIKVEDLAKHPELEEIK